MAIQPDAPIGDVLPSTPSSRKIPGQQMVRGTDKLDPAPTQQRFVSTPPDGYDPRAPRGTYVDIFA